jgi:hypothetical protein
MAQAAQDGVDPFKKSQPAMGGSGPVAQKTSPPVAAVVPAVQPRGAGPQSIIARVIHYFNDSVHIALFLGGAVGIAWLLSLRRKRAVV